VTQKVWPDDARQKWNAAVFQDSFGSTHLLVSARRPDGVRVSVLPLQFKTVDFGAVSEPVLSETHEERADNLGDVTNYLQAIVNAAWEHGIKPEAMKDHRGELGATKAHLEDMRALVFKGTAP
jgi:hypothetical protein